MPLTYFYAELFGVMMLVAGLALLANRETVIAAMHELSETRGALLVSGTLSLFVGLVIVLTHNEWSGSTLALVVTILGWLSVLKGLFFFFAPHRSLRASVQSLMTGATYRLLAFVALILGIYLVYNGFWGY